MTPRILIVEDEPDIAFTLRADLLRQGYESSVCGDGDEAIRRGREECWDLIILDVMLPGANGFEVCATLRRGGVVTPIIILTAKTRESEKEFGLDAGADDYVTKPFSMRELRARIRAQLRRSTVDAQPAIGFGACTLDLASAQLTVRGVLVDITAQEFRLLHTFVRNQGRVLSREQLIEAAWGSGIAITDRVVDTHVFNLRKKIEVDAADPKILLSVRGLGYRLDPKS